MIIVCQSDIDTSTLAYLEDKIQRAGYHFDTVQKLGWTVIFAEKNSRLPDSLYHLEQEKGVEKVIGSSKPYRRTQRCAEKMDTVVELADVKIGGGHFAVIAGPCAVESEAQMHQVAKDLIKAGVTLLRAGAYKGRTSPYAFQGLGKEALHILADIRSTYGLSVVTEVMDSLQLKETVTVADILQIGSRNCQNYPLLQQVARSGRPILLKRGFAMTLTEWLLAAEYLMLNGCDKVILCERGVRSVEASTRFNLDLSTVVVAKQETHLPVIVDPSHATGKADLVLPLAKAAIAIGADGLMIETHPTPSQAMCDAMQQIPSASFQTFMAALTPWIALRN